MKNSIALGLFVALLLAETSPVQSQSSGGSPLIPQRLGEHGRVFINQEENHFYGSVVFVGDVRILVKKAAIIVHGGSLTFQGRILGQGGSGSSEGIDGTFPDGTLPEPGRDATDGRSLRLETVPGPNGERAGDIEIHDDIRLEGGYGGAGGSGAAFGFYEPLGDGHCTWIEPQAGTRGGDAGNGGALEIVSGRDLRIIGQMEIVTAGGWGGPGGHASTLAPGCSSRANTHPADGGPGGRGGNGGNIRLEAKGAVTISTESYLHFVCPAGGGRSGGNGSQSTTTGGKGGEGGRSGDAGQVEIRGNRVSIMSSNTDPAICYVTFNTMVMPGGAGGYGGNGVEARCDGCECNRQARCEGGVGGKPGGFGAMGKPGKISIYGVTSIDGQTGEPLSGLSEIHLTKVYLNASSDWSVYSTYMHGRPGNPGLSGVQVNCPVTWRVPYEVLGGEAGSAGPSGGEVNVLAATVLISRSKILVQGGRGGDGSDGASSPAPAATGGCPQGANGGNGGPGGPCGKLTITASGAKPRLEGSEIHLEGGLGGNGGNGGVFLGRGGSPGSIGGSGSYSSRWLLIDTQVFTRLPDTRSRGIDMEDCGGSGGGN